MSKRLIVAGTGSGAGKTTVTLGIMAALKAKGYAVQGFKCGPDYIDPTYHTAVTGRPSRNLDSWMCPPPVVKEMFARGCQAVDIAVIEGVMGLFDGKSPLNNEGSTAEIAALTDSPVLLVVDCGTMARSAAAIVWGFQSFSPYIRICGVIANQVGSKGHYELIREAVEQECGIPVLGYLEKDERLAMPERHLGLVPSIERGELEPFFGYLADSVAERFDLDRLRETMGTSPAEDAPVLFKGAPATAKARIAVAKDEAFSFYYPENLELLEHYGAECVYFSPLRGERVPNGVQGLYIGGGFPEEYAAALSRQHSVHESIREAVGRGVLTLAECGGFMYLTEEIVTASGERYPMVGLVPGRVKMQGRLAALGYREIAGTEGNFLLGPRDQARGHEYHYSVYESAGEVPHAYETTGMRGRRREGYLRGNLVAGYTHLHFASAPEAAKRWVDGCAKLWG